MFEMICADHYHEIEEHESDVSKVNTHQYCRQILKPHAL